MNQITIGVFLSDQNTTLMIFAGVVLLYIVFKLVLHWSKRKAIKAEGLNQVPAQEQSKTPGEVYAAIAMALHEMQDEAHDVEDTVLTIARVQRSYSPWSSKIHTLRQTPVRK